ncbi:MAG TPA: hypothetical protein VIX37_07075 [Candidatus Sulfotelmatobacter sp.]
MSASCGSGGVRGSGSAPERAGARWNACGNENGAGAEGAPGATITLAAAPGTTTMSTVTAAEMSLTY